MLVAASIKGMLYSDSLRKMMQNAVNESFWDAHGVEIGPCAIFGIFPEREIFPFRKFFSGLDAWGSSRHIHSNPTDVRAPEAKFRP